MSRYIDADALIDFLDIGHLRHSDYLSFSEVEVANILLHAHTADVLDRKTCEEVYKQIMWERDVAIGQLKEIGKSFGEKMDDVAPVVHGHWELVTDDKYRCSVCRVETRVDECFGEPMYKGCPYCFARMDGKDGETDGKKC